jgi:hypothetical protein
MIDRKELPESVGLMYYDPEKRTITTKKKAIYRKIEYSPDLLLYVIYSRLDSDRIPFYSDRREYFEAYLQEKKDNRDLARRVKTKLVQENARMEREIEETSYFKRQQAEYKAIKKVLGDHGICGWRRGGIEKELDEALSRTCPEDVGRIREELERIVERMKRMEEQKEAADNEQTIS